MEVSFFKKSVINIASAYFGSVAKKPCMLNLKKLLSEANNIPTGVFWDQNDVEYIKKIDDIFYFSILMSLVLYSSSNSADKLVNLFENESLIESRNSLRTAYSFVRPGGYSNFLNSAFLITDDLICNDLLSEQEKSNSILTHRKKVAFVVGYVPVSESGAHIRLLVNVAGYFAETNEEFDVEIIVTAENSIYRQEGKGVLGLHMQAIESSYNKNFKAYVEKTRFKPLLSKNLAVTFFEEGALNKCFQYIRSNEYGFIFFWTGKTGSYIISRACKKSSIPIGALFFNNKDSAYGDWDLVVRRNSKESYLANESYIPFPHNPDLADSISSKASVNINDHVDKDAIKIVTVLADNRVVNVFKGYNSTVLDEYFHMLSSFGFVHVFVGVSEDKIEDFFEIDDRFKGYYYADKIKFFKRVDGLLDFLKNFDVMLHLPGCVGGAGGIGIAKAAKIPVLCFDYCDAAPQQHPEYLFRKGQEALYFDMAKALGLSKEKLKAAADKQAEYQEWFTPEEFALSLKREIEGYYDL